jgi:hypothetical protein
MSEEGHGWSLSQVGWFELSLCQGVNNLHTFATEKKAQGKRRIFNLKYNIKSFMF